MYRLASIPAETLKKMIAYKVTNERSAHADAYLILYPGKFRGEKPLDRHCKQHGTDTASYEHGHVVENIASEKINRDRANDQCVLSY